MSNVKCQKLQGGFTLLESLVAIAVFTVGVSTAVVVIVNSGKIGSITKNKIIAAHLAQEGIEVIRNIRDRNWLSGVALWYQNINDDSGSVNSGCVEYDSDALDVAPCVPGEYLAFTGSYYRLTSSPSPYLRTVTTELLPVDTPNPGDPERLHVTATVTCGANCSVSLNEYLYDWK